MHARYERVIVAPVLVKSKKAARVFVPTTPSVLKWEIQSSHFPCNVLVEAQTALDN
jgi:hypothetical protein